MARFGAYVNRVYKVLSAPNSDNLSLNYLEDKDVVCVTQKNPDGTHKFNAQDLVIFFPESAILPDWLLQQLGYWKDGKGMLDGPEGNRVKPRELRGNMSDGIIMPVR